MGTRLVIDGNSVYEIDEDCQGTGSVRLQETAEEGKGTAERQLDDAGKPDSCYT